MSTIVCDKISQLTFHSNGSDQELDMRKLLSQQGINWWSWLSQKNLVKESLPNQPFEQVHQQRHLIFGLQSGSRWSLPRAQIASPKSWRTHFQSQGCGHCFRWKYARIWGKKVHARHGLDYRSAEILRRSWCLSIRGQKINQPWRALRRLVNILQNHSLPRW